MWLGLLAFCLLTKFVIQGFIFVGSFLFILDTLPTILLHIQYWSKNRKATFYIDTENKTLLYELPNLKIEGDFNEITSLLYYSGAVKTGFQSYSEYRYCKIGLQNGKIIIVTILMISEIEKTLEILLKIKPESHKRFLPFIK